MLLLTVISDTFNRFLNRCLLQVMISLLLTDYNLPHRQCGAGLNRLCSFFFNISRCLVTVMTWSHAGQNVLYIGPVFHLCRNLCVSVSIICIWLCFIRRSSLTLVHVCTMMSVWLWCDRGLSTWIFMLTSFGHIFRIMMGMTLSTSLYLFFFRVRSYVRCCVLAPVYVWVITRSIGSTRHHRSKNNRPTTNKNNRTSGTDGQTRSRSLLKSGVNLNTDDAPIPSHTHSYPSHP